MSGAMSAKGASHDHFGEGNYAESEQLIRTAFNSAPLRSSSTIRACKLIRLLSVESEAFDMNSKLPSRRTFVGQGLCACVGLGAIESLLAATLSGPKSAANINIENFSAAGKSEGVAELARVVKTEADWRKQLTPDSFEVTRHAATERPFSGEYADNHKSGVYRCICCATALFDSNTKFESGTGWPSYWRPISRLNVAETTDNTLGMRRAAVSCALCDAHLGHVFDDGPRPTGLRYCMNSVSLKFVPRA